MKDFISGTNMYDLYETIAAEFPEITTLSSIGKSFLKRDIMVLEIGSEIVPSNATSVVINSLTHS